MGTAEIESALVTHAAGAESVVVKGLMAERR